MKRTVQHCWCAALFIGVLVSHAVFSAAMAANGKITVFAAASLTTALEEIAHDFTAKTGTEVVLSFAGSGTLARQIAAGAPVDVFVSADEAWMTYLADQGVVDPDAVYPVASNRLVLVQPTADQKPDGDPFSKALVTSLLGEGRMAMADPETVPAGRYGKAALENTGLWSVVGRSVAPMENVRIALTAVSRGDLPLGLVYASDAEVAPDVRILAVFPETSHPEIRYPAAALNQGNAPASAFVEFMKSSAGEKAFKAAGFLLIGSGS